MKIFYIFSLFLFLFFIEISAQQQLTIPQASQRAEVMQRIGLTDIKIIYHRPAVNSREIWGKLVPYNQIWRAGANENTTISFSDNVKINGETLPAGTYGLFMIPSENEWTIVFSKNNWSWGHFYYDESEDALRINANPETAEHKEYLEYSFEDSPANSATLVMHWEKLKIPFQIEVDVHEIVINNFLKELDNIQGFFWQGWNQAASYALMNNVHLDEAMQWVEKSIGMNRNFTNLMTKSGLLEKNGNKAEAGKLKEEAMSIATEAEVNNYGYQLLFANRVDEAIEIFKKNVEDHPESWNVYDSLGEGYAVKGEKKLAKEYYSKALDMVKDENQKTRITNVLTTLE